MALSTSTMQQSPKMGTSRGYGSGFTPSHHQWALHIKLSHIIAGWLYVRSRMGSDSTGSVLYPS